jgi:hypothetical protein
VHVEQKLVATGGVGHFQKVRAGLSGELLSRRVRRSGDQDELGGGASGSDRIDGSLHRCGPALEVGDVVGLVHDTEDDLRVTLVLASEL